jgi:hypothetical protein
LDIGEVHVCHRSRSLELHSLNDLLGAGKDLFGHVLRKATRFDFQSTTEFNTGGPDVIAVAVIVAHRGAEIQGVSRMKSPCWTDVDLSGTRRCVPGGAMGVVL